MSYLISHRSYGGLRVNANVTAQSIGTTPELVNQWDEARPASADITSDILTTFDFTVTDAGDYEAELQLSITSTASVLWTFEFYIDGVASGIQNTVAIDAAATPVSFSMGDVLTLAAGEAVSVYALADGLAKDLTITDGRFKIERKDGFEEV